MTHRDRLLVNGIATLAGHTSASKVNMKAQVELDPLSQPDLNRHLVASSIFGSKPSAPYLSVISGKMFIISYIAMTMLLRSHV